MRIIALDVHRTFAQVAVLEDGKIRNAGRIDLDHSRLLQFAKTLKPDDEIIIEATGNTNVIVRLLSPFVGRVAIANPILVRAIAWAKVKTDKIDAAVLAKLHASGFLPEVWMPDEETETRRRVVAERAQLVSQITRLKNRIQSVLHANLIPPYKGILFSQRGRTWLTAQPLPEDQRRVILRHAGELDRLGAELAEVDKSLAQRALEEPRVKRLMTITGVNATVAMSVLAAIGDIRRFSSQEKLVSYFGTQSSGPAIRRQTGLSRPHHETRSSPCAINARRSGLGYFWRTRPAACILHPDQRQARQTCRCCGDRAQAGGRRLAYADQGRGLHLEPSGAPAVETSETRAQSRSSVSPRRPSERIGRRLQQQVSARQRARGDRQCRGRIPPVRCELETAIAKGALGRPK